MKKKIFTTEFIVQVGILTAIEVVLYIIGQFIQFGPGISINLALIPIAIGAILFGPFCGLFLGAVNGIAVILTPGTQAYFMNTDLFGPWCIFGTILICLIKCSAAGFVAGILYRVLKKHNDVVACVVAALAVPVINTTFFVIGACIFFTSELKTLLISVFSFNFLIEIGITALLTPAIIRIIHIVQSKENDNNIISGENNEEK